MNNIEEEIKRILASLENGEFLLNKLGAQLIKKTILQPQFKKITKI